MFALIAGVTPLARFTAGPGTLGGAKIAMVQLNTTSEPQYLPVTAFVAFGVGLLRVWWRITLEAATTLLTA